MVLAAATLGCSAPRDDEPRRVCRLTSLDAPRDVQGVVDRVNALVDREPEPVTVACFLESLPRPLHVHATESVISLQPSTGERTPRIFVFQNDLILSVVPAGTGSELIEMGALTSTTRSVKAEVKFPLSRPIDSASPYEHVKLDEGTTCRVCHADERPATWVTAGEAFESLAFRPQGSEAVDLEFLRHETEICDVQEDASRCAMLSALFAQGSVVHQPFPDEMGTIDDF